jgi:putative nucleotidyltransferase with HDIG domain
LICAGTEGVRAGAKLTRQKFPLAKFPFRIFIAKKKPAPFFEFQERSMKRVLFVDDDAIVLEGLRRLLEPQKDQWEMAFAPDGQSALTLLAAAPFDVIVSDMTMPAMDGAALLQQVCERYSNVVRILLANPKEMEGALRAVSVAHQFLVKPCDPNMLRVAIARATSLSDVVSSKLLESLVGSVKDLPVLPRTYMALREKLADPDVSVGEIVGLIEQDVAISAKILQLVNSAFFGLPREVTMVRTAVTFLGIDMVQNLVLSASVFRVFEKAQLPGFSFDELYAHSQLVAKIAAAIPAAPHVHSTAVVAALLHDVGKLVLATRSAKHFERAISGARTERKRLFEVEEQLTKVSHAEVGAYLLSLWGLPSPVVEAVARHHHPERVPHDGLDAVGVVHIANCLSHEQPAKEESAASGEGAPAAAAVGTEYQALNVEFLESLGIADQVEQWRGLAAAAKAEILEGAAARK